jgi:predicted transcriptional regulator
VLIIAIAIALFLVKVLVKKGGEFTSQHIHDNEALRQKGIHCVMDQDREAREANKAF